MQRDLTRNEIITALEGSIRSGGHNRGLDRKKVDKFNRGAWRDYGCTMIVPWDAIVAGR